MFEKTYMALFTMKVIPLYNNQKVLTRPFMKILMQKRLCTVAHLTYMSVNRASKGAENFS